MINLKETKIERMLEEVRNGDLIEITLDDKS